MDQITESITWHHYLEVAEQASQSARYVDAEKLYQKALSEAKLCQEDTSSERADMLGRLGDLYKTQSWFPEALETYSSMLALCEEKFGPIPCKPHQL